MSYINSTLFFEPVQTKTKNGDKRIMFKARSKSGGAKAELFAIRLDNLTAREELTLMRYFKKISFSASVHIKRKTRKTYSSKKYSVSRKKSFRNKKLK